MYKAYKHLQQYYATNTAVLSIQNTPCLIQLKKKMAFTSRYILVLILQVFVLYTSSLKGMSRNTRSSCVLHLYSLHTQPAVELLLQLLVLMSEGRGSIYLTFMV